MGTNLELLERCLLHTDIVGKPDFLPPNLDFMTFKLLEYPMSPSDALQCLYELVKSVSEAIKLLHDASYAHVDIRLANVCFSNDNSYAVLIDLDRAVKKDTFAADLEARYGSSVMYKVPTQTFTAEEVDWLQLGWMIVYIIHHSSVNSYHKMNSKDFQQTLQDGFISKLVKEGETNCVYI